MAGTAGSVALFAALALVVERRRSSSPVDLG
jgi:hypothetical protein